MTFLNKLEEIRIQMKNDGVSAYVIPSADPHISEYVPDRYKCIEFASGFTGSAGTLVITADFAGLWTDARYFVQAAEQLAGSGFELVKLRAQATPEYIDWLLERLPDHAVVAFDANLISVQLAELLANSFAVADISVSDKDYLDSIWNGRPALPAAKAWLLNTEITGNATADKLTGIRSVMKRHRAAYHLVSSLDDIAWIFNIRGADVKCNPVVLAFALISTDDCTLFIDEQKLSDSDKMSLSSAGVQLCAYENVYATVESIQHDASILIDPKRTCQALFRRIAPSIKVIFDTNPSTAFKAIKNDVEVANTRKTMIQDGVALTRFFRWLEEAVVNETVTEISVAERLRQFRAENEGFVGESFDTIAGYREHGALPHYKATPASDVRLLSEGLFLLDSGGQYATGTTDITRVVSLGKLTEEEARDYTLVLRGMIEGSTARFPKGTKGYQIDAITRKPLWDHALNYGHGTGHGVGYFLNVHEGPQVFNAANIPVEIETGMITSVEPGLYRPYKHGIRIENLVLTVKDEVNEFAEFYTFETLTVCYIDTALIKKDLLLSSHIDWLNSYNAWVFNQLASSLSTAEQEWLLKKTAAI